MKKLVLLTIIACNSLFTFSQFSVSAGPSFIKPFGQNGVYSGLHLSGEFAVDDLSSFYGRFIFMPSKKGESKTTVVTAKDFNTSPPVLEINSTEKFNYSVLELGKRYYFGEGYESGFSFYGGTNVNLIFNKVSFELDDFDKTKYETTSGSEPIGSIVSFGFGLNGGLKHSFTFGTLYFDTGLNYNLLGLSSNATAQNSNMYANLFFNFNFGFRKYLY
jgi:hypothetical protein